MSRTTSPLFGWALALLAIALFSGLGMWQLDRGKQKQAMLAEVNRILTERKPQSLAAAADPARVTTYDWAQGAGRFTEAPAVLLDNQSWEGRPGVRVFRVFQPDSGTAPMLVELGWLPLPGDRKLPRIATFAEVRNITGLLAPPPSAGIASAVAAPQADGNLLATSLDRAVISAALKTPTLAPRVLKLDPALDIGYERNLDILPNTLPPERHFGYALQWFGLALAVFVTALVLTRRKRKQRGMAAREKMPE